MVRAIRRGISQRASASDLSSRKKRRGSSTRKKTGSTTKAWMELQKSLRLRKDDPWYGVATRFLILESQGTERRIQAGGVSRMYQRPACRPRRRFVDELSDERIAGWMSALAHPQRVAIMKAVFCGAGSYADLRDRVPLKAGPMYHHLRELRLAGVIATGPRDVYRLTPIGTNLLVVACSLGSIRNVL